ncbi:MAG: adenylate kinase [Pseudomonadales bacterium]|nr:adenylate kinase [Pseudomonadales bacterium]MBO6596159.1 adenylate kinase [Pseudomonadales bacterium]MBO6822639.1 adenylate kinase [Pseudomonadales bacterium]
MIEARRINVVGTSGSGKSNFARKLSKALAAPYVELDALHWEPNWTEASDEVLFSRLEEALSGDAWVLDGNYKKTIPIKWRNVDMVVWLDLPLWLTFYQVFMRTLRRSFRREALWSGNRESIFKAFFSRDSILLWCLTTHGENRRRYLAAMNDEQFPEIEFVRLRSRKAQEQFLNTARGGDSLLAMVHKDL